ncbi:MAG: terpene synthase family protein [Pseudonocardiaceae bacterium]
MTFNLVPDGFFTFYSPFSEEVSSTVEDLETGTLSWAEKFDLGQGDARATLLYALTGSKFMCHVYPHAKGNLAQALSDYSAWGFAANDHAVPADPAIRTCDVLHTLFRWVRAMRSPDSWVAGDDSLSAALRDTFLRLRDCMTPVQMHRFTAGQTSWLLDQAWETSLRERGAALTVNEYLAMRIGAGGAYAATSYIDAVEGIEVPDQEWASPIVRAAAEAGMMAGLLDNDRYSLGKESHPQFKKYNIFDAIRHENPDFSPQQAMLRGIAIRDCLLVLYIRLCGQFLQGGSEELRQYFVGVDRIISGNITYGTTALRYLNPASAATIRYTEKPPADLPTTPLQYPTIAWWWDHLK